MVSEPFVIPFSFTGGIELFFYILLFFFTLHALFLGYHWFAFGTDRRTPMVALAVYLGGGAILFLTLATSLFIL